MIENNFSNENKRAWSKKKRTTKVEIEIDDSLTIEDDVNKDPDWKSTPLYNRIQKLQVITMQHF